MASSNKCAYRFSLFERQGENCPNPQHGSSEFCILHANLPGADDPNRAAIRDAKKDRQQEKIRASDFDFEGAQLVEFCVAEGTEVKEPIFYGATFNDEASFDGVTFRGGTSFLEAKFSGGASFRGTTFSSDVEFSGATFTKELYALDTQFSRPVSQEQLCRAAKRNCESRGDKDEADKYHYREMEAKRKQKGKIGYLEKVPFQWILGYGVKPLRTFGIWLSVIGVFALYYWMIQALLGMNSPLAYLYFSVMTAITPGYGGFNVTPETYLPASIEAVFGAFM